ncbi:MAG: exosortase system-associated protein, TIGR04073 family [Verrucomicrobiota bacterium]
MRTSIFSVFFASLALVFVGCAGPEHKLGRGINNFTEFARGGEIHRSIEQSALFRSPEEGATTGLLHGVNRSVARTFVGLYEIITAPFPPYDPVIFPVNPVYPDSYRPGIIADSIFDTDTEIGFSGGDVAPFVPGSRFKIFE